MGSLEETESWFEFAQACDYINEGIFESLYKNYESLGSKLFRLHETWK